MTKKSLGYVELEWICPNCGTRNPGPQRTCTSCGSPQPEDVAFEQPAQADLVKDEAKIAAAKAGPDIHCYYCGTRNPATAQSCSQCGAPLSEGAAREYGKIVAAFHDKPVPPITCPNCGASNAPNAPKCAQCGASLADLQPKPAPPSPRTAPPRKARIFGIGLAGLFVLTLCAAGIAFLVLANRTEDVIGQVQQVQWTREIAIEAQVPVTYEAWRDEIPADAVVGTCTQKIHHTQDEPTPNAVEVCGTPYTVDTGTGYGEVVQDCRYQVYADWCEYSVQEWQVVDKAVLQGSDLAPRWPEPHLQARQRPGPRREEYTLVFDTPQGQYTYQTGNEALFRQARVGSRWILKINTFNVVTGIEPTQ